MNKLQSEIMERRDEIIGSIEEKTGLSIEYGSISPIIVDSIIISDLSIQSYNLKQHTEISGVIVKFSLINIILSRWKKIDPPSIISSIYLKDGSVTLDFKDKAFYRQFASGAPSNSIFKGKVFLDNIDVYLIFGSLVIKAEDTSGSLTGKYSRYYGDITTRGTYITNAKRVYKYISSDVVFKGYFSRNFKNIDSRITLKNSKSDMGVIKDLDADFQIVNGELKIKNRDKKSNLDYLYIFRIPIYENYFSITGDNFKIRDLFTPAEDFNIPNNYLDSVFSGTITGTNSLIYKTFLYSANGNVKINNIKINNIKKSISVTSNFNFIGDQDHITFRKLNLSTNIGFLAFTGGLDLHSMYPNGNFYLRNIDLGENLSINSDFRVKVINDKFINVNFDYIEGGDIKVSDISSIIYLDGQNISLQGLKRDGDGKISLSGNYNIKSKEVTSSITVNKLKLNFIDNFINSELLNNYLYSSNLSFKAGLTYGNNGFKYSISDLVLYDENEKSIVELEGQGEQSSFSIDYLKIDIPDFNMNGRVDGNIKESRIILKLDALINDNKYNFDIGIKDRIINATGSYGFKLDLALGESTYINLKTDEFPITFRDYKLKSTINLKSAIFSDDTFLISIPTFITTLKSENIPFEPYISFSADGSDKLLNILNLEYSDGTTILGGILQLKKESSGAYSAFAHLNNGDSENITIKSLISPGFENLAIDLDMNNFLLDRLHLDGLRGKISSKIIFSGTRDDFIIDGMVNTKELVLFTNSTGINFNFKVSEELLTISDFKGNINNHSFALPLLTYNYPKGDLLGKINTDFIVGGIHFKSDLALDLSLKPIANIYSIGYESFSTVNGKITVFNFMSGEDELFTNKIFRVFNNSSALQVYSLDRNLKLLYSYDSGMINARISKPYFTALNLTGVIKDGQMDVSVRDLNMDLSVIDKFLNGGTINSLNMYGQFNMAGPVDNPLINGLLWADAAVSLENIPAVIKPIRLNIRAVDNKITILDNSISIGDRGVLHLGGEILWDSWKPDSIVVNMNIPEYEKIPIKYQYGQIITEANLYAPELIYFQDNSGSLIHGRIVIEDGEFYTRRLNVTEEEKKVVKKGGVGMEVDMTVEVGSKNKLYWPNKSYPVVKANLKAGDSINIKYKSVSGDFNVVGKISIVNGEVDYSGNPFILKEGEVQLDLSKNQIDPYIKILGTKTVIDDDDRQVEVLLTFEGGFFSDFKPMFSSSDPGKTDDDISRLVGIAVTGDDLELFVFDVIDEYTTSLITAPFEDSLKDLFGADEVKIKSGFISSLLSNITNNSFDSADETGYTLSEMVSNTSLTVGYFVTDDFFTKGSVGVIYQDDEFNPDVDVGFTLYSPHFQLGFNVTPKMSDYVFEPELSLSLEWVFNPGTGNNKEN